MNKFLTLIKRDVADYKGALIITPLVIAGVILLLVLSSVAMGTFHVNGDSFSLFGDAKGDFNITDDNGHSINLHKDANGQMVYTDENGVTKAVGGGFDAEKIKQISTMLVFGNYLGASLPLMIAMVVVIFVLSSSLYEERKDKSIMFWKSMPISDIETVIAKAGSIIFVGLGFALLVTFALHLFLILITAITTQSAGLFMISIPDVLGAILNMWVFAIVVILCYILWAFPVYTWILTASSYAPKAPFLLAFVPIVLMPLLAKIFLKGSTDFFLTPLQHITGYPVFKSLTDGARGVSDKDIGDFSAIYGALGETFKDPSLWIGLVVGAALIYAASEIRRRRSF